MLSAITYITSLSIPLIEDDYPNIARAQAYGSLAGLPNLLADATFRLRSTSYWAMDALWQTFHLTPVAYHLASLSVHTANVFLLYAVAAACLENQAGRFAAAAFFAVQEGHQEAIMWFSGINELLMFFFGISALLCWLRRGPEPGHSNPALQVAGPVLFAFALLSKESAIVFLFLFMLMTPVTEWRRRAVEFLPYLALAALALCSIEQSRTRSFRFSDGSFSFQTPFPFTWARSEGRLLWVWGWLSLLALFGLRGRVNKTALIQALAWMGIALIPYSFLTYSTQIPSRQTYLASAGLSLLFGLAIAKLRASTNAPRYAVLLVLTLAILQNAGYVWIRKRRQFLERAAPTEQLIAAARRTSDPIWIRCFPRSREIAEESLHIALDRPPSAVLWGQQETTGLHPVAFCYKQSH